MFSTLRLRWAAKKLLHPSAPIRCRGVRSLGSLADLRGVSPLLHLWEKETDKKVRCAILEALGQIGDPQAIPVLAKAANEAHGTVRVSALNALRMIPGDSAEEAARVAAINNLTHSFTTVRRHAAKILHDLNWSPRSTEERVLSALGREQWGELGAEGKNAVEPLLAALQNKWLDQAQHLKAVRVLGEIGDPRAGPLLVDHLTQRLTRYREAGLAALLALKRSLGRLDERTESHLFAIVGRLDSHEFEKYLTTLGYDLNDPEKRIAISITCCRWKEIVELGPQALAPLCDALSSQDREIRAGAAKTLGQIGDPSAYPHLVRVLFRQVDYQTSAACAKSIVQLGCPAPLEPFLVKMASEQEHQLTTSSMDDLVRMGIDYVASRLRNEDAKLRREAAHALRALGWQPADDFESAWMEVALEDWESAARHGVAAVPALLNAACENDKRPGDVLLKMGTPAIDALISQLLETRDFSIVSTICSLVARSGDPRTLDVLRAAYERHPDSLLLIDLIGETGDPRGAELLLTALQDCGHNNGYMILHNLLKFKEESPVQLIRRSALGPQLQKLLDSGDKSFSDIVCRFLRLYPDPTMIRPLLKLVRAGNKYSFEATEALHSLIPNRLGEIPTDDLHEVAQLGPIEAITHLQIMVRAGDRCNEAQWRTDTKKTPLTLRDICKSARKELERRQGSQSATP